MLTVFLDANVLVPVALADTILRCAERELFRPAWSERVLTEAKQAILTVNPDLSPSRVDYRLTSMRQAFPEATVTNYEKLIEQVHLPDPDDRHVVAAAHRYGADLIVTNNLKHFPKGELFRHSLEVVNADHFLQDMLDLAPNTLVKVITSQAADMKNPPRNVSDILITLGRAGVTGFVQDYRALTAN